MRCAHDVATVRVAEAALMERLPDGALMRRAAAGLAAVCARMVPRVYGSRIVLLVGSGDNGGDALYAGARLARRGARVRAVAAGSRLHAGGRAALRSAGGRTSPVTEAAAELAAADLIIDGLVGIGARGGLRAPHAELARLAGQASAPTVAVDLPSGVDADTGEVTEPAVRADVTVTFGTYKPGLLVDPGAHHAGVVELVDIGLDPMLPEPVLVAPQSGDIARALPGLPTETHKYRRGVVGIAAGSDRYPGAAVLCVGGALRVGGAGMVRYSGAAAVGAEVLRRWPETVVTAESDTADIPSTASTRVDAWVLGSGRGTDQNAAAEWRTVLASERPVVLDADGLTLLSRHPQWVRNRTAPTVLTPHAGELARLLPGTERTDVEARRLAHVRRAADELGCTVLLKGSTTVVAEPGHAPIVNPTGTPLLATAGSGDVLAGMIGSLLASGQSPLWAAACGAFLHGLAARIVRAGAPIAASDLPDGICEAVRSVHEPT
ncbi:NAD(P)H-hydrate dehydratase [Lipingzhangella sp. LS1_29]|uniref:Bifunctional NAD(P)H-hydrate repair enzyme n=1 Tax=Lipingzhangella rawalii TaxID=2055835 RepID=A0ABU2H3N2_9ACTN|nr:NAD(P)H-hydrate dehydratase [Lipingzhangella rawalii]MDS1269917.1 NAD(P)H-hydrate dehydratase [Lipingzhangella rawalii]